MLAALLWLAVRAPVGGALKLQPFFSPATFFRPLLGPLSGSAGALALAGRLAHHRRRVALAAAAAAALVRHRCSASCLLLVSPYLISSLGRGITPPAGGVSVGLWLSWHLAILVSAAALIVPTAALFRGLGPRSPRPRRIAARRRDRGGRDDRRRAGLEPARRLAGLVHLPLDAGALARGAAGSALGRRSAASRWWPAASAALVTWGAELTGKIQVAERDIARLGVEPDPLAVPLLERFGEQVLDAPAPTTGIGDVRALARLGAGRSGLSGPPRALVQHRRAARRAGARLARSAAVAAVHDGARARRRTSRSGSRSSPGCPGVHYVLLVRVGAG